MKKILLFSAGGLLLAVLSVGATLFFTGFFDKEPAIAAASADAGEDADYDAEDASPRGERGPRVTDKTFYYNFQPEFVVNFGAKSRPRFLMVEVAASTYDESVAELLDEHTPLLRNELLILFGNVDSASLLTAEGKTKLLETTLEAINEAMEPYYRGNVIEEVFFTRFVMQ